MSFIIEGHYMPLGVSAEFGFTLLAFSALYWASVAYTEIRLTLPWDR